MHDCDLAGVVLSGGPSRLEFEGIGEWTLKVGDAFYVKAGTKHRQVNLGKRDLKQVTVMNPPKY